MPSWELIQQWLEPDPARPTQAKSPLKSWQTWAFGAWEIWLITWSRLAMISAKTDRSSSAVHAKVSLVSLSPTTLLLIFCTFWIQFSKIKRISYKAASHRLRQLHFWLSFPAGVCFPQSFFDSGCDGTSCPERGSVSPLSLPLLVSDSQLQWWNLGHAQRDPCAPGSTPSPRLRSSSAGSHGWSTTSPGSSCSAGSSWRRASGAHRTGAGGARWRRPGGRYPVGSWNSCHCVAAATGAVNKWLPWAFSWSLPGGWRWWNPWQRDSRRRSTRAGSWNPLCTHWCKSPLCFHPGMERHHLTWRRWGPQCSRYPCSGRQEGLG